MSNLPAQWWRSSAWCPWAELNDEIWEQAPPCPRQSWENTWTSGCRQWIQSLLSVSQPALPMTVQYWQAAWELPSQLRKSLSCRLRWFSGRSPDYPDFTIKLLGMMCHGAHVWGVLVYCHRLRYGSCTENKIWNQLSGGRRYWTCQLWRHSNCYKKCLKKKEEKSFARSCNISVSGVLLHLSFPSALRSSQQGKRVLWQVQFWW